MLNVCRYNNIGIAPSVIQEIEHLSQFEKEFFSGACFTCAAMVSEDEVSLQRCGGCQLVSYCNKNCQKADWKQHKILCKKFPVENGRNVIVRKTDSIRNDIMKFLLELDILVVHINSHNIYYNVENLFQNARVCRICREARPEMLFDCHCCSTSYCSKAHQMQDYRHWSQDCDVLYSCAMANWYLTQHRQLQIPDGLLNEANLNDGLKFEKVTKMDKYFSEKWLQTIVNLVNERLAFPLTIHHVLKTLKLGEQKKDLSEITSLTIHIVHDKPMLDPRIWEFFLHQLPNLKKMNLTFISGHMKLYNNYNSCLPVERCSDCCMKQRVITYNIQFKEYHEYFSSNDYVEPDVVAVFCCNKELMFEVRKFTSQMNMTYNKHTVVILTDPKENTLEACVKTFHDARPVNVLLPIQDNPVCGFSTLRGLDSIINENAHVCCIQRKH